MVTPQPQSHPGRQQRAPYLCEKGCNQVGANRLTGSAMSLRISVLSRLKSSQSYAHHQLDTSWRRSGSTRAQRQLRRARRRRRRGEIRESRRICGGEGDNWGPMAGVWGCSRGYSPAREPSQGSCHAGLQGEEGRRHWALLELVGTVRGAAGLRAGGRLRFRAGSGGVERGRGGGGWQWLGGHASLLSFLFCSV